MAKVILPLGSFSASGQIGRAFVYFPWKGIKCVREYIVPANPNTSGQQTQRGFFRDAVDDYHATGYNALDLVAWRKRAGQSSKPLTYFNSVVKEYVDALVKGWAWDSLSQAVISGVLATAFDVDIDCASDATAKLYWGVNPGYMPNEVGGAYAGTTWTFNLTGLPAGTWIYFYVKNTLANRGGITGIYVQKTA